MKRDEKRCLTHNKVGEGKDYPQIHEEINTLNKSQLIFKEQGREIRKLNTKIRKLEDENKKLKKEKLVKGLKPKILPQNNIKNSDTHCATIKDLIRIIIILKSEPKGMTITELRKINYGSKYEKIKPSLVFLIKYNIVGEKESKYFIK